MRKSRRSNPEWHSRLPVTGTHPMQPSMAKVRAPSLLVCHTLSSRTTFASSSARRAPTGSATVSSSVALANVPVGSCNVRWPTGVRSSLVACGASKRVCDASFVLCTPHARPLYRCCDSPMRTCCMYVLWGPVAYGQAGSNKRNGTERSHHRYRTRGTG